MTVIAYQSSEDAKQFSGSSYVEVISTMFSVDRDNEEIILNVYCEATTTNKNSVVSLRVLLNTVEGAIDEFSVPAVNAPHAFSSFRLVNLSQGAYILSLEVKSTNAADTIMVRRIRVYAMKH